MFRKAIEKLSIRLDVLRQYRNLLQQDFPEPNLKARYKRQSLLLRGLCRIGLLERWHRTAGNPRLTEVLERHPHIRGAIYWPYLHNDWTPEQRFEVIDGHYRLLDGPAAILLAATRGEVRLASLRDSGPELRLVLDKPKWFMREGEVVLNLFQGEARLYSVAFALGLKDGERLAYVGAIQGSNLDQAAEIYRQLTRELHGLRPRDLTILALRMLCGAMGIERLMAVSHKARHHESAFFGNLPEGKIQANYDEIWSEQGGRLMENGFFELPARIGHRDLSEIPSRKRATYRRRYEMLDGLGSQIRAACAGGDLTQ